MNYDSGDYFIVDGAPASYEAFEEALGKGVEARNTALAAGDTAPTPFTIAFTSYVFDDPSDIAQFTAGLGGQAGGDGRGRMRTLTVRWLWAGPRKVPRVGVTSW